MATRNRPEAVAFSLPLLIGQSRPPARILIVDSSENPEPIAALVGRLDSESVPILYLRSSPGLPHQRNVGLEQCRAEVVMFPDDDALYYPDVAAQIMEVYETDATVAAVCGRPAARPPASAGDYNTTPDLASDTMERLGLRVRLLARVRQRLQRTLEDRDPVLVLGRKLNGRHPRLMLPPEMDVIHVPYMTGFRMTFRRAAIIGSGFDETLTAYAPAEDIDGSFSAMRWGPVVAARKALIYHQRVTGARADGFRLGLWGILNRSYVVLKHIDAHPETFTAADRSQMVRRLRQFMTLRILGYAIRARDDFGRARLRGAWAGLARLSHLAAAQGLELSDRYAELTMEGSD
jgi:hypothetical protein